MTILEHGLEFVCNGSLNVKVTNFVLSIISRPCPRQYEAAEIRRLVKIKQPHHVQFYKSREVLGSVMFTPSVKSGIQMVPSNLCWSLKATKWIRWPGSMTWLIACHFTQTA